MFYFDDFLGKKILKSTLLSDYDCFFTTREFVLTAASRPDLEETAQQNRKLLINSLKCDDIVTAKQVHGSNIEKVLPDKNYYDNTDALISNIPSSLMLLNFADCTPIILYSKKDNAGAVIHAGWRGTAANICAKTVEKMSLEFNIKPSDITALIGPAIGKCCFETHEDVFHQLIIDENLSQCYDKINDKYFIDLKLLNKYQLAEKGVQNVDICDYCTCCMSDIFFSYRKEKGITARHSAVIKIKGDK